ncbi:hypothetical protein GYMLUDRAFT_170493 [Collybiopsis luxurians FD-317 M1]|uniref:L-tryptophan decarboxylase PsiD-like domain-containing protein n=1 Tax=Collybiopsis luxurians FD-317 M1 TaxID=944289 RepID=A0A0D0BTM1_9AGAR|nr:hypothetical protein GYMLUDRAFT_170493 [Collybiopsis luxurians FD-317 M1]
MPSTVYNGWLPSDPQIYQAFVEQEIKFAKERLENNVALQPSVQHLKDVIEKDTEMKRLSEEMFRQSSSLNSIQIASFDALLGLIDGFIVKPPQFFSITDKDGRTIAAPLGVPIYLIVDLLSNTAAAHDLFQRKAFNDAMKGVLDAWGTYLKTSSSTGTLTTDENGWFSTLSLQALELYAGKFDETYKSQPSKPYKGYTSWDNFFTRELLKPDVRPLPDPSDKWAIANACESTTYHIRHGVKEDDKFWLKGQNYSLYDMLGGDEFKDIAKSLVDGTVYQAYLSPQDYHRWHSPVGGTIRDFKVLPGAFYAVLPDEGASVDDPVFNTGDARGALLRSQAWNSMHAARAVIFIDNPDLGLVVFIGIGMAEVSTCEVTVTKGKEVKRGDQLGMFHFGGSSHALIFDPKIKVEFEPDVNVNVHRWINKKLATAELRPK